ncbi:MAG: DUF1080 domain-containing protein [Planctomycetota bacterium]|nr:MAG: DUF1080 domain-containing protein [Planctomycetota bacterium]
MPAASILSLLLCLATGSLLSNSELRVQEPQPLPQGFVPLFNGKNLEGWYGRPHLNPYEEATWEESKRMAERQKWNEDLAKHWSVEGDEIVNDGHGVFLTTEKEYGDMELWLEYKTVAKADSGIYLRCTPQVQIWDTTEEGGKWEIGAKEGSGSLWNNQKAGNRALVHADRPFGQWNRFRILMIGDRTSVWLNGHLVVDHVPLENYWDRSRPLMSKGAIQLQTHGGEIRFRNLYVRELTPELANAALQLRDGDGFQTLFNGRDLSGWVGAVDHYEVVNGAIRCKPGSGGNLFHEKEFADFILRFEFRLPPGGNNGLGIRAPLQGDVAYSGMELQILDNTAEKYANLKPYQYHGSIYGVQASHRGFLRPVGQWNFQEVVARGTHLTVNLNGTTILEAKLDEIEEPMDGRDHPGLLRKSGYLGFAGHHDPVEFRNIRVKPLP